MMLSLIALVFVTESHSILLRRSTSTQGEEILKTLSTSADSYKTTLMTKMTEPNEKLNDKTCAAFKEQGDRRVKELDEATKFIESALAALEKRIAALKRSQEHAKSKLNAAAEAEAEVKANSLKTDALAHVDALLKAADTAEGVDSQTWKNLADALERLEAENISKLTVELTAAKDARAVTSADITKIFTSAEKLQFCSAGASAPDALADSSAASASSPKTSSKLQEATVTAAAMLRHAGHVIQIEDELKLETRVLTSLTTLQTSLEEKAKSLIDGAFEGLTAVLDKVLRGQFKDESPEFSNRRAALLDAEKALQQAISAPAADAANTAKDIVKLNLMTTTGLGSIFA